MPRMQSETFNCVSLKETTPHVSTQQTKPQALRTWSRSHPLEKGDFIMPFQIHLCLRALQTSTWRVLNRATVIAVIFVLVSRLLIISLSVGTFCKTRELLAVSILLLHQHLAERSQLDSVMFSTVNSSFQQFMSHLKNILLQQEEIWQDFHSDHFRNYEKEIVSCGWYVRGRHRERNQLDGAKQTLGNLQIQPVFTCTLTTRDLSISKANSNECFEGKLAKITAYKFLCMLSLPFGKGTTCSSQYLKNPSARRGGKEKSRVQGIW